MGLDVYLYRYEDYEDTKKRQEEYETASRLIWDEIEKGRKYEELTQVEKDDAHRKSVVTAHSLGLDDWGSDEKYTEKIEKNSEKYPEHMFKIGYLRSSYNDGGINSVLDQLIGYNLYGIFEKEGDESTFRPNWEQVKKNAKKALKDIKKCSVETGGTKVLKVDLGSFFPSSSKGPKNSKEALNVYAKEWKNYNKDKKPSFGSYGNAAGEFYLDDPLKLRGIIKGTSEMFPGKDCVYLIFDIDEGYKWYAEAMEIVIEMCDYVLAQKDKEKFYLHWSA